MSTRELQLLKRVLKPRDLFETRSATNIVVQPQCFTPKTLLVLCATRSTGEFLFRSRSVITSRRFPSWRYWYLCTGFPPERGLLVFTHFPQETWVSHVIVQKTCFVFVLDLVQRAPFLKNRPFPTNVGRSPKYYSIVNPSKGITCRCRDKSQRPAFTG